MTAQEQIAKLESLLDRIRRNAEKPRPVVAIAVAVVAHAAKPAAVPAAPPAPPPQREPEVAVTPYVEEPTVEVELPLAEVSLDAIGATETAAPAAGGRERVPSADMDDLEIVELGSDVVELGQSASSNLGEELDEPVPESAPRPAVQSVEVELEPPIKTPPPESGRQAVTPPPAMADTAAASSDDDFDDDDLLEPDLSGAPISLSTSGSPTMAQLGDTVQLEPATAAAEIELAAPPPGAASVRGDALEAELPKQRGAAGTYDAALAPPSSAAKDLERHREVKPERDGAPSRRVDPLAATVPDMRTALSLAQTVPDARSPFADAIRASTEAQVEPAKPESPAVEIKAASAPEFVVERPAVTAAHAAEVVTEKPRRMPETFVELLDASLELRA